MSVKPIAFDIRIQMLRMREHLNNIIMTLTGVDPKEKKQDKLVDTHIKHLTVHYLLGESNSQYQSVKIDGEVFTFPSQSFIGIVIKYLDLVGLDPLQRYSLDPMNDEGEELFTIIVDDLYCSLDDDKFFIELPQLGKGLQYHAVCQGTIMLFYPVMDGVKPKNNSIKSLNEIKALIERNEQTKTLWNAIIEINEREDELERINEMEGLAKQRPLMPVQPIHIPLWQPVELKDFYNNDLKVFPNIDAFSYGTTQYHPNIISLYHGLGR